MSSELQYGCVYCRTGTEKDTAKSLEHHFLGLIAVVAEKLRYRRSHGIRKEERVILFPGYVFFSTDASLSNCDFTTI